MCVASSVLSFGLLCWAAQAWSVDGDQWSLECSGDDVLSLLQTAITPPQTLNEIEVQAPSEVQPTSDKEKRKVGIYAWSSRGGNPQTSTSTRDSAPTDLSKAPTVLFSNPQDEEVRHSPLIDDQKNIYITSPTHIRKFSPDGKKLWDFLVPEADGKMSTSPAMYDGSVYAMAVSVGSGSDGGSGSGSGSGSDGGSGSGSGSGSEKPDSKLTAFSIDLNSGKIGWKKQFARRKGSDSQGILAYNDTVILPVLNNFEEGSDTVLALKTADGSKMWEYTADDVMWNFKPSTPGDGSVMFSSSCGAVHRIDWNGKLIWKKDKISKPDGDGGFCSMGGGAVGPNGVFYAVHGEHTAKPPAGDKAFVNAYRISDGKHLWSKTFNEFGGQYPAVGYLGKGGPLAVVAPIGTSLETGDSGSAFVDGGPLGSDKSKWLVNAAVAMDAETGNVLWRFEEKPYGFAAAADDYGMPFLKRTAAQLLDKRVENICLPDPQGIPLISGDGHVYMSSSHTGDLFSIRDADADGEINPDEVSTFSSKVGFLNSPSLAQGMLVAAPCWGPVYMFKD